MLRAMKTGLFRSARSVVRQFGSITNNMNQNVGGDDMNKTEAKRIKNLINALKNFRLEHGIPAGSVQFNQIESVISSMNSMVQRSELSVQEWFHKHESRYETGISPDFDSAIWQIYFYQTSCGIWVRLYGGRDAVRIELRTPEDCEQVLQLFNLKPVLRKTDR